MNHLAGAANELVAQFTGAGEKSLVAPYAVRMFLPQDVLLPEQRALTLPAVEALRHFDSEISLKSSDLRNKTQ